MTVGGNRRVVRTAPGARIGDYAERLPAEMQRASLEPYAVASVLARVHWKRGRAREALAATRECLLRETDSGAMKTIIREAEQQLAGEQGALRGSVYHAARGDACSPPSRTSPGSCCASS